jgi:hypothetical protein
MVLDKENLKLILSFFIFLSPKLEVVHSSPRFEGEHVFVHLERVMLAVLHPPRRLNRQWPRDLL